MEEDFDGITACYTQQSALQYCHHRCRMIFTEIEDVNYRWRTNRTTGRPIASRPILEDATWMLATPFSACIVTPLHHAKS